MSSTGPKNKLIKAQFNNLCTAAVVCEMKNIVLTAGDFNTNLIDVGEDGIYMQTAPGKGITFGTYDIRGPIHKNNPIIFNEFLPGAARGPSATFNLNLVSQAAQIGTIMTSLGVIL